MNIDRIKNFGNNSEVKKASPLKTETSDSGNDNIRISSTAKEMAEEVKLLSDVKQFTLKALSQAEDSLRLEKISHVKSRLLRGEYDFPSEDILQKTADNFLNSLIEK